MSRAKIRWSFRAIQCSDPAAAIHPWDLSRGIAVRAGLYFRGFFASPTGTLRDSALEARWIAEHTSLRIGLPHGIPESLVLARYGD